MTTEYDGIVVGGGPAGATAATVLAQHGRKVMLLERDHFPRYHVGESLIPYTWFTFERLGVLDWFEKAACPKKHSVQFVSAKGQVSQPFYFFQTIKHECATTWQVLRTDFDQMMLDNATAKGVTVRHGVTVRDIVTENGRVIGVRTNGNDGAETLHAKVVIDATGRDTLLASKMNWKHRDPDLNKIAIFTYFSGAKRDPGLDEGATTVAYIPDKGWFWYIPLSNDRVSVGVVADSKYLYRDSRDPESIFCREAEACTWIKDHLAQAQYLGPMRVTGEFSYRAQKISGDGFCLVGDAYSFLDPVFSSGLFLALKSGELAADAIHQGLDETGAVTSATFSNYEREFRWALDQFRQLVLAFYNESFNFGTFIKTYPELQSRLVDALVGNVYTDLKPLFNALSEFSTRTDNTRTQNLV